MKNINGLIPKKLKKQLLGYYFYFYNQKEFQKLKKFDNKRYAKYGSNMQKKYSFTNLRSKITFHYHSIEKGLSNTNFRPEFGKKALSNLFYSLDLYIHEGYSPNDSRFQQALSTLDAYIKYHEKLGYSVPDVRNKFKLYEKYLNMDSIGIGGFSKKIATDYSVYNFKELATNRHSVRDFGEKVINLESLKDALALACLAPSVCNRQSVSIHVIQDKKLIKDAINIQGGLKANGENLQYLILVTSNKEYMAGPHERNQTYIDGGIYVMNLVYSLTYSNIATCILNADFNYNSEIAIRNLLPLKESEDLIAFIGVGSFPSEFKIAKSPRVSLEEVLNIY